ncbi:MAG: type II toxin-antitoxin system VapC family toxin [Verrucomicrobia bacterium]|nr:MAG: type II toxin-antitoxin system VapC family toxin [Verrucomicrobiota bacterium]
MIVVDSSVISFLFLEGELTESVKELHRIDSEWITPPILNHEMLNILAVVGTADQAVAPMEEIWRDLRALLGSRQQVPDPLRSLHLAIELKISGYEAQYVALAQQLNMPLVTEEQRLLEQLPALCLSIEEALKLKL